MNKLNVVLALAAACVLSMDLFNVFSKDIEQALAFPYSLALESEVEPEYTCRQVWSHYLIINKVWIPQYKLECK
jgi:hypothetical protein